LKEPTEEYWAHPLDDNLFEWHFTVQGPPATDFEGGVYHGRILLPTEYPMKPPNIILLTVLSYYVYVELLFYFTLSQSFRFMFFSSVALVSYTYLCKMQVRHLCLAVHSHVLCNFYTLPVSSLLTLNVGGGEYGTYWCQERRMNARFNKCCYSNSSNIFSSLPCPEQL